MEDCVGGLKLNLGCGSIRWGDGWLNVDVDQGDLQCDIRDLPVDEGQVDAIAAIHVLEHFQPWEVPLLLAEWRRALKPGGKLILELPCMDKVIAYIYQCMKNKQPLSMNMTWFAIWGNPKYENALMMHKWGYTHNSLEQVVQQAGFEQIKIIDARYHFPIRDMRLEAVKP